jgi:hypothetical protein
LGFVADVYLPETHSPADLELAAMLALALGRESLVVCWSLAGDYFDRAASDTAT